MDPNVVEVGRLIGQFLIAPVIPAVAVIAGVLVTQRNQRKQEALKDRRGLRDQKRERLRRLFEKALLAAIAIQQSVAQRNYLLEGETIEQRDQRLAADLAQATRDLDQARVSLMLDSDGERILDHFHAVVEACTHYSQMAQANADHHGRYGIEDFGKAGDAAQVSLKALREAARAHLDELEKPIDTSWQFNGHRSALGTFATVLPASSGGRSSP